ncbi:Hypothetical protein D9617_77g092390 [Elsinoe fawcettii]|nr:Hypothetical protein D9617_77g092390 [Elsinoe fawcettii]
MEPERHAGEALEPRITELADDGPEDAESTAENLNETPPTTGETLAERLRRLREERARMEQELEVEALEEELEQLRRLRSAGHTPGLARLDGGSSGPHSQAAASEAGASSVRGEEPSLRPSSGRPRLRDPKAYEGKTIKEARSFIRDLELVFALSGRTNFPSDREKILYGVMFLAGEPKETWHHRYSVDELDDQTWLQFTQFVLDAVDDPVNRGVRVTLAYEGARQKDGQSIQAFASEMATLEEQLAPYSEEQRVRHLLAKLHPSLRNTIIKHHSIPRTRQELVSLGARIESTDKASTRRLDRETQEDPQDHPRKKQRSGRWGKGAKKSSGDGESQAKSNPNPGPEQKATTECFKCGKMGHWARECRSKQPWGGDTSHKVRKVNAKDAPEAENEKGSAKGRS